MVAGLHKTSSPRGTLLRTLRPKWLMTGSKRTKSIGKESLKRLASTPAARCDQHNSKGDPRQQKKAAGKKGSKKGGEEAAAPAPGKKGSKKGGEEAAAHAPVAEGGTPASEGKKAIKGGPHAACPRHVRLRLHPCPGARGAF